MVRQQDIADRLGVSATTVSLALRDDPQISAQTKAQVRRLALEMGYVYRPRKATHRQTTQIAFVGRYGAASPFYWAVLSGAEKASQLYGVELRYVSLEDALRQQLMDGHRIDALMMVSSIDERTISQFLKLGCPVVLIDNNLPHLPLDRVLIENANSLYRAATRLAELGHQRIAFLCGPDEIPSFRDRAVGYRAAMADLGLEPEEIPCADTLSFDGARQPVRQRLSLNGRPGFTALLACSDKVAIGALHALQDHGLRVPEDVSLVGFDDIDAAQVTRPRLSTVHVHRELMGELGVELLMARLEDPLRPAITVTVDTTLIERESAGPYKEGP